MFLDTSGLLNLLHSTEPFQRTAVTHYANAALRLTHNLVLAEFIALAQVRGLRGNAACSLCKTFR